MRPEYRRIERFHQTYLGLSDEIIPGVYRRLDRIELTEQDAFERMRAADLLLAPRTGEPDAYVAPPLIASGLVAVRYLYGSRRGPWIASRQPGPGGLETIELDRSALAKARRTPKTIARDLSDMVASDAYQVA